MAINSTQPIARLSNVPLGGLYAVRAGEAIQKASSGRHYERGTTQTPRWVGVAEFAAELVETLTILTQGEVLIRADGAGIAAGAFFKVAVDGRFTQTATATDRVVGITSEAIAADELGIGYIYPTSFVI